MMKDFVIMKELVIQEQLLRLLFPQIKNGLLLLVQKEQYSFGKHHKMSWSPNQDRKKLAYNNDL
jgi:hypothetical protein